MGMDDKSQHHNTVSASFLLHSLIVRHPCMLVSLNALFTLFQKLLYIEQAKLIGPSEDFAFAHCLTLEYPACQSFE